MTQHSIETFRTLAPLLMPQLFDLNHLESIDDYDDYALMAFSLAEPIPIETLLDDLEDQMELNILYHMQRSGDTDSGQHCCAYSSPSFEHMYKINAQTEIVLSEMTQSKVTCFTPISVRLMLPNISKFSEQPFSGKVIESE